MPQINAQLNHVLEDVNIYREACELIDKQRNKLIAWRPELDDSGFMRTAEILFLFGMFSTIADTQERREKHLTDYLHMRRGLPEDRAEKLSHDIGLLVTEEDPLFDTISALGSEAYTNGGDGQEFIEIAKIGIRVSER